LGFEGAEPAATGRPSYHPAVLLKIYIYGYLNRIQSSRRLEREAQRNVELMWLTGRLAPDFKTIADFRKDHGDAIRKVCREFVLLCRRLKLFTDGIVAIDGSKFKAVNNRDKNFTDHKLQARIAASTSTTSFARRRRQFSHRLGRVRLLTMDRFWAAHPQRLLCGGELGEASVKTRPKPVLRASPNLPDARIDHFRGSPPRSCRSWPPGVGHKPSFPTHSKILPQRAYERQVSGGEFEPPLARPGQERFLAEVGEKTAQQCNQRVGSALWPASRSGLGTLGSNVGQLRGGGASSHRGSCGCRSGGSVRGPRSCSTPLVNSSQWNYILR
jgi:transposase